MKLRFSILRVNGAWCSLVAHGTKKALLDWATKQDAKAHLQQQYRRIVEGFGRESLPLPDFENETVLIETYTGVFKEIRKSNVAA